MVFINMRFITVVIYKDKRMGRIEGLLGMKFFLEAGTLASHRQLMKKRK